jgi:RNase P subunit RPR2
MLKGNCYECNKPLPTISRTTVRVEINSPRGIKGFFVVCGQECAEKLRVRLLANGWQLVKRD